ncbi:MAG: sigma-70 family RNA polymerase sigma factor [Ruminococcus sp.]|nr:sigma-70 family RNA polymerase sigma factor [Ruminococcus sp.]
MLEDNQIVEMYFMRDQQAITQTDIKYGALCRSISVRIVTDTRDAEECVSDTYMHAWNSIPPQRPQSLAAFLGRIVRNLSLDCYRKKNAQKRSCECVSLDELSECVPDTRDEQPNTELTQAINEFLEKLPQEQRMYFMRRYYLGEPLNEIAERYGVNAKNLGVTMHRLRERLKKHLIASGVYSERGVRA